MTSSAGGFADFGDAEKVKYVEAENAAALAHLDEILRGLDELGAEVEDPDGLISFRLGYDRRLLDLRIAEGIGDVMTNLELEQRLNALIAAGTEAVDAMHAEFERDAYTSDAY